MHVQPEQIFIGAGTEYLYGLLIQLLGFDKKYAIENPGYEKNLLRLYMHSTKLFQMGGDCLAKSHNSSAGWFRHQFWTVCIKSLTHQFCPDRKWKVFRTCLVAGKVSKKVRLPRGKFLIFCCQFDWFYHIIFKIRDIKSLLWNGVNISFR